MYGAGGGVGGYFVKERRDFKIKMTKVFKMFLLRRVSEFVRSWETLPEVTLGQVSPDHTLARHHLGEQK